VLPTGFHRIRHYGLLASRVKADNLGLARKLLDVAPPAPEPEDIAAEPPTLLKPCPCYGSPCASSKRSRQASLRDTGRPRCPPPSGSTPHEPGQPHSPLLCRSVSLVQDRPRQRSSEPASRNVQIGLGPLLPGHPSLVATIARPRNHSARHLISGRIRNGPVEIPIEPAAALPRPAGSFPEGFRRTAPVLVDRPVIRADIRNPLQLPACREPS
jgi:hypothetical protein